MNRIYRWAESEPIPLRVWGIVIALSVLCGLLTGCAPPPPNLTPAASLAFQNIRVIKGLDVLRDAAIDAERAVPPQLSTETTRKVVLFHQSALRTINATGNGWRPVVAQALAEVGQNLPPKDRALLEPYFNLIAALLKGLP